MFFEHYLIKQLFPEPFIHMSNLKETKGLYSPDETLYGP